MSSSLKLLVVIAGVLGASVARGQEQEAPKVVPKAVPVPVMPKPQKPEPPVAARDPSDPPPQNFIDPREHLYFHLGAGWHLTRKDKDLSTFHLDARTAPANAQLRAVAMLAFNPYPTSTFSGAMLSYSVTPRSTELACKEQTRVRPEKALGDLPVGGISFSRGLDEHGRICTESRDVTYTALQGTSCLRFDLTVNTFCGGDVSGVEDMTDQQLANVFKRLVGILDTVEFRAPKNVQKPAAATKR